MNNCYECNKEIVDKNTRVIVKAVIFHIAQELEFCSKDCAERWLNKHT